MLHEQVIDAVREGRFHILAIDTIDEGMELLTGVKALPADAEGNYQPGSLHALVLEGLARLDKDNDKDEDDDPPDQD